MNRRDQLQHAIQQTAKPLTEAPQVYPTRQPAPIPTRKTTLIKSTPNLEVTDMGIIVRGKPDESEWLEQGNSIFAIEGKLAWWAGDWYNAGDRTWQAFKYLAEKHAKSWRTFEDYAYICRNVAHSCRHEWLSLSHHKVVAPLFDENNPEGSQELQRSALQHAAENNLSVDDFRDVVRRIIDGEPDPPPALPDGKEKIPGWQKRIDAAEEKAIHHWQNMTMKEQDRVIERVEQFLTTLKGMKRQRKK